MFQVFLHIDWSSYISTQRKRKGGERREGGGGRELLIIIIIKYDKQGANYLGFEFF